MRSAHRRSPAAAHLQKLRPRAMKRHAVSDSRSTETDSSPWHIALPYSHRRNSTRLGRRPDIFHSIPGDPLHGLQNVVVEYYDVSGTDEQSINASIQSNSPRRPDGSWALGQTRYTSRYRPLQMTTKGVCKVTKLDSQLGAIVVLPRLVDESSVPMRIRAKWGPFIAGLKEHERGISG